MAKAEHWHREYADRLVAHLVGSVHSSAAQDCSTALWALGTTQLGHTLSAAALQHVEALLG